MGMDVHGKRPTTEAGKYFGNNIWWWRPLASYVCEVAPDIAKKCSYWQSNDGDGLGEGDSAKLADRLQQEIDSGRTARYAQVRQSEIERMANERCPLCEGTGTRKPVPHRGAGNPKAGGIRCNQCGGDGHVRPEIENYPFNVENVQEFVTFLRGCGGFEIY